MFRNFSVEDLAVIAIALDEETEIEDGKQKKKRSRQNSLDNVYTS